MEEGFTFEEARHYPFYDFVKYDVLFNNLCRFINWNNT